MSRHKFILNDETKTNQYGFRVLNKGLDLERFRSNPVLLDYHSGGNQSVIGRWENITIEGHLLTAVPVFDMEDDNARFIAGKVERGFIKGASLGLNPFSMDNFKMNSATGDYELVKSEVLEASIVPIPNNANAVKLYASTDEGVKLLQDSEASQILLMANEINEYKLESMKKIKLSAVAAMAIALNADTEHDVEKINQGIIALKSELDEAKNKLSQLEQIEADKKAKLGAKLVEQAIKDGKITATEKELYVNLYATNPELAKHVLEKLPGKTNLGDKLKGGGFDFAEVKTIDDFEKLTLSAQIEFKENEPEAYKALFQV